MKTDKGKRAARKVTETWSTTWSIVDNVILKGNA